MRAMNLMKFLDTESRNCALVQSFTLLIGLLLALQPVVVITVAAQGRQARRNAASASQQLTEDQRIAHVLARLGFGARPVDFERVKAMGVNAYIEQQLDPDSIDDTALDARLNKLPTLALAIPTLIELYTPPKPAPSPSPTPTPSPTPKPAMLASDQTMQATTTPSPAQMETKME